MVASTLFRFIFQPIEKFCNVCVGLWICRLYHLVLTKPVLPKWKSGLKRFRQINHSLNEDTMKNTSTSGQQENGRTDSSPIPSISFPSVHSKIKTMNKLVLIRNQQKKKKKERKKKKSSRKLLREFPDGPVVRTRCFHCRGQVQSLVGELRSCKLCGTAKKKRKRKRKKKGMKRKKEVQLGKKES